jgi:hypothetical protein
MVQALRKGNLFEAQKTVRSPPGYGLGRASVNIVTITMDSTRLLTCRVKFHVFKSGGNLLKSNLEFVMSDVPPRL